MVKKALLRPLFIVSFLISLIGCDLFTALLSLSPFPGYLAQAVASKDMTDAIEAYVGSGDAEWRSNVHVLKNVAKDEYVFLIIRRDFGGQRVYALDTDLNLITYASITDHNDINLVDANDDFIVGDVLFDRTDMSTTPNFPDVPVGWDDQAFSFASRNYILRSNGVNIDYDKYLNSWGFVSSSSTPLGSPDDMWLRGIGFDPEVSDPFVGSNPVYLILASGGSGQGDGFLRIVRTPALGYDAGLSSPIFINYTVSSRVYDVRGHRPSYYTRKGVVAETRNRGRYVLVDLAGAEIKKFSITNQDEPTLDFDIDGEYYYIFDEQDMRLYKAATGF
jgi:hypothetical protein